MTLFTKTDLTAFTYKETARADHDDPNFRSAPDSTELNRTEAYEVVRFMNWFVTKVNKAGGEPWTKADGPKLERLIQAHPGTTRKFIPIKDWMLANWNSV
jgi:hypothetical protein